MPAAKPYFALTPSTHLNALSEFRVARRSGEGDHVADIGHSGGVEDRTFKAQAEAGVGHGAVAAKVAVPGVGVLVEVHLVEAAVEDVEAILALGAADDLADAGGEDVHGGDGAAVVVLAHVEGLDLPGIVHHDDGAAD